MIGLYLGILNSEIEPADWVLLLSDVASKLASFLYLFWQTLVPSNILSSFYTSGNSLFICLIISKKLSCLSNSKSLSEKLLSDRKFSSYSSSRFPNPIYYSYIFGIDFKNANFSGGSELVIFSELFVGTSSKFERFSV